MPDAPATKNNLLFLNDTARRPRSYYTSAKKQPAESSWDAPDAILDTMEYNISEAAVLLTDDNSRKEVTAVAEQDRFYDWFKADMRANEERQRAMEARIEAHALESEKRLNEHMKQTEARMDEHMKQTEARMDEHMKQTEARMDAQMSRIEARFDKIDDKMEVMQTRLEEKIETKLHYVNGMVITAIAGIGAIAVAVVIALFVK